MKKIIALGCDHAGFELKEKIKSGLLADGYECKDFGTHSVDSVDYPDFVHPLAEYIETGTEGMGILICGSGNGVAMAANKHSGIRAALCWNQDTALLARQHNDANVLCLPSRFITEKEALQMTRAFMETAFEGGRHAKRVEKIAL